MNHTPRLEGDQAVRIVRVIFRSLHDASEAASSSDNYGERAGILHGTADAILAYLAEFDLAGDGDS